jgi:hypothetical protein
MTSFRIRTRVESETLVLPDLKPLIGKMVEIRVTEQPEEAPAAQRWRAAADAVEELTDYDVDAWTEQRAFERERGENHLK